MIEGVTVGVMIGVVMTLFVLSGLGTLENNSVVKQLNEPCKEAGFTDEHCRNLLMGTQSDWFEKLSQKDVVSDGEG